jgi:hypothetical protein
VASVLLFPRAKVHVCSFTSPRGNISQWHLRENIKRENKIKKEEEKEYKENGL